MPTGSLHPQYSGTLLFVSPCLPPLLEVLLDVRGPLGDVNLAGSIRALGEPLTAEGVARHDPFGGLDDLSREMRRDEDNARRRAENDVAREHRDVLDAHRQIDAAERHIQDE